MATDLHGRLGGVYVDFENLKYSLDDYIRQGRVSPTFDWADLLYRIKERIESFGLRIIIGRAYADFDNLGGQGQLQLLGFDPRYILASPRKNSADIQLSIDVMEVLLSRPEITDYIIVAGDRDYLPIVRKIQEQAKRVWVMGFERATSGDLRTVVGDSHFVKLDHLVPTVVPLPSHPPFSPAVLAPERVVTAAPVPEPESLVHAMQQPDPVPPAPAVAPPAPGSEPLDHATPERIALGSPLHDPAPIPMHAAVHPSIGADGEDDEIRAIRLALDAHGRFGPEIWLTPFLRDYMNDAFPYLNHQGRKMLIERLRRRGAIRIYQKDGQPQPYSVFEVNLNDPVVRSLSNSVSQDQASR